MYKIRENDGKHVANEAAQGEAFSRASELSETAVFRRLDTSKTRTARQKRELKRIKGALEALQSWEVEGN